MKKRLFSAMLALLTLAFLAGCSGSSEAKKALATVNGEPITQSELDQFLPFFTGMFGEPATDPTDEIKAMALEELITLETVTQNYADKSSEILPDTLEEDLKKYEEEIKANKEYNQYLTENKISMEFLKKIYTDQYFMNYFLDTVIKPEVLGMKEQARQSYEERKDEFLEVSAYHILLEKKDKALAEEVLKRAEKGEDFTQLAKEYSIDKAANEKGGDLGYFKKGMMVPEFQDAAFSMEPGQIKGLVETTFGYHIIKLTDKRYISFEDAFAEEGSLYSEYFNKVSQEKLDEMESKLKITRQ